MVAQPRTGGCRTRPLQSSRLQPPLSYTRAIYIAAASTCTMTISLSRSLSLCPHSTGIRFPPTAASLSATKKVLCVVIGVSQSRWSAAERRLPAGVCVYFCVCVLDVDAMPRVLRMPRENPAHARAYGRDYAIASVPAYR